MEQLNGGGEPRAAIEQASSQSVIDETIKIIKQQLTSKWKRQRAPQGLRRKFVQTCLSDASATWRIFLSHGGLRAWIAYILATEGKLHFHGRHDRDFTIGEFQRLPSDDRIRTARLMGGIKPHPSVFEATAQLAEKLDLNGSLNASGNGIVERSYNSPADSSISIGQAVAITLGEQQTGAPAAPQNWEPHQLSHPSQHLVLEVASLKGITDVFDPYMCGAIRRDTVQHGERSYFTAAVTMTFPLNGLVDCLMSIAIHPSKVEYLAMALFGVHVESAGQVRYVVAIGGAKLVPNPEITLKGAQDDAVIRVLGFAIHEFVFSLGDLSDDVSAVVERCQTCSLC